VRAFRGVRLRVEKDNPYDFNNANKQPRDA